MLLSSSCKTLQTKGKNEIPKVYFPTFPQAPWDEFQITYDDEGNKLEYHIAADVMEDWLYELAVYANENEAAISALYW